MKVGAENKTKTYVAIALMVASVFLAIRGFTGFFREPQQVAASTPAPAVNPAPQRAQRRGPRAAATVPVLSKTLDPRLRLDLLRDSEQVAYEGKGRNIFRAEPDPEPIPKVVTPPIQQPEPVAQPAPPPPPPIRLRFFGFANQEGEPKKVFLADGDEVFVAGEGEIVNRRYKVMRIGVNTVEILDVLNNNVQTIPLTQS